MSSSIDPKKSLWFYANENNEPIGPLSFEQLTQLQKEGVITPQTNVLMDGGKKWVALKYAIMFPTGNPTFGDFKAAMHRAKEAPPQAIQEYRRTCKGCGKVWHSLVEREKAIEKDKKNNECDTLNLCSSSAVAQAKHNVAANESEISRLRRCPECHSAVYCEEIITHDP